MNICGIAKFQDQQFDLIFQENFFLKTFTIQTRNSVGGNQTVDALSIRRSNEKNDREDFFGGIPQEIISDKNYKKGQTTSETADTLSRAQMSDYESDGD